MQIGISRGKAVLRGPFRAGPRSQLFGRLIRQGNGFSTSKDWSITPKPIPRWDVHFGEIDDDRKDSTAPHITFSPQLGGHR